MTRKTKEEKKLADYRRRLKFLQQSSQEADNLPAAKKIAKTTNIDTKAKTVESLENIEQQTYFKKDLRKSLIFICLIITLEIIIYFAKLKI